MNNLLSIQDNKIVINDLILQSTSGAVVHDGNLSVKESVNIDKDLSVAGTFHATTIKVDRLITNYGAIEGVGQWISSTENELNGRGLSWTHGNNESYRLMYRSGGRLWANADIDLSSKNSYKINNVEVLNANQLGPQVKKSSLTEVGTLRSLSVTGDANFGEFFFVSSLSNRVGINTEEPNGILSLVDNNIEIIFDALPNGTAVIGTHTNHDFSLISDSTPRITVKNNGEIHVGDEQNKNGVLRVFGALYADNVISDTRLERTTPLEFKAEKTSGIYGKGLIWSGSGPTKQLVMKANPDRLWSTESIDLSPEKQYYINGIPVLSENSLGSSITKSNLSSVGTLNSLSVSGTSDFGGDLTASSIFVDSLISGDLSLSENALNGKSSLTFNANGQQVFYSDNNEIEIGNNLNTRRPVKVFGPLSIGISNPDLSVDLAVKGNISFSNKKFITGASAPTEGGFSKGDICWNSDPKEFNYVGWVCVGEGSWLPFGAITRQ